MIPNLKKMIHSCFGRALILTVSGLFTGMPLFAQQIKTGNLAVIASVNEEQAGTSWNDGKLPKEEREKPHARPKPGNFAAVYSWRQPVKVAEVKLYWWDFKGGVIMPKSYRISYWDGSKFVPVKNVSGLGLTNGQFNTSTFTEVSTIKLRLDIDSTEAGAPALQEWVVVKNRRSPAYPPVVNAGADRVVMLNGKTYLRGEVRSASAINAMQWSKISGPGSVKFSAPDKENGTAVFSKTGTYVLRLKAFSGKAGGSSAVQVKVVDPPPAKRLDVVYTRRYKIDSKFWNARVKAMIVNWIPHCIDQCDNSALKTGGIENFIEAAKALRGEPHARQRGRVFANAWVYQTLEAACEAMMIDPQGDKEIIAAQQKIQQTIDRWIPIILAAQEPDGYIQTSYTLRDTSAKFAINPLTKRYPENAWAGRWAMDTRGNHEGYVMGYFIESAINHYTLTEGKDLRLYNAAKKLADCWVNNIGPGKKMYYDGHQEMEQALVRFGRFVKDMEGSKSHGDSYVQLARFLLDNRKNGTKYDQSHVPVQQQYEAVGHAVRATYTYSGMADVAAETGDTDYQSAVMSIWDNMVNRKYYLTGGIGSGETSEGFGDDYSLPNNAYCESCSSCGLVFFEYKMNLAYHDARYADLYEETIYNALLGSLNLDGKDFLYTNPLSAAYGRYRWHDCPCCVGNIPRTLLMMPTWAYVRGEKGIYVNLYVGSTIKIDHVAGTTVEMVQQTDYPWEGKVNITVNPEASKEFTVYVRVPDRNTSELYNSLPQISGLKSLSVNGSPVKFSVEKGYAAITRTWKKGDKISIDMPMGIQQITANNRVKADSNRVALRYGPLVYNVESADNANIRQAIGQSPFSLKWNKNLLQGVMTIEGRWADGSKLLAIPNYSRLNRTETTEMPVYKKKEPVSVIWMKRR